MTGAVRRRSLPWLLSIPLMLGGTELAHWLAFRLVYPNAWDRAQALQQSGHGYFGWLPLACGIGAALLVSGLFLHGQDVSAGRRPVVGPGALYRFAALPPLAFALQEHLEQLLHTGSITGVALEPTFMLGLALQLPFALAAYLLARLLLGLAERVGGALTRSVSARRVASAAPRLPRFAPVPLRVPALAGGHAERGPPF
jgi:hypothetical protein